MDPDYQYEQDGYRIEEVSPGSRARMELRRQWKNNFRRLSAEELEERHWSCFEELCVYIEEVNARGEKKFKEGELEQAFIDFREVYDHLLGRTKPLLMAVHEANMYYMIRKTLEINLAEVCFERKNFVDCLTYAKRLTHLLILESEKYEAYYWCAKASDALGSLEENLGYLKKAADLLNVNQTGDVRALLEMVEKKVEEKKKEEREKYMENP